MASFLGNTCESMNQEATDFVSWEEEWEYNDKTSFLNDLNIILSLTGKIIHH